MYSDNGNTMVSKTINLSSNLSMLVVFFYLITCYGVDNVIKKCIICDKRDRAVGQLTCDSDKCKEAYRNKGIVKEN